jgi:predicted metal-dependent peptidase
MIKGLTIFLISSLTLSHADEIVKARAQKKIISAGDDAMINIVVEVMEGYHIQANKVSNEFIPTTLEIKGDHEIILKSQVFPQAKKFKLEGTEEYLDVYDGRFEINIFFKTQKEIKKGIHQLNGILSYQACNAIRCLFPRSTEFAIEIEVR